MKALHVDVLGWLVAAIAVFVLAPVESAFAEEPRANDDDDRGEVSSLDEAQREKIARQASRTRERALRRARTEAKRARAHALKAARRARRRAQAIAQQRALATPEVLVVPVAPEVIVVDPEPPRTNERVPRRERRPRDERGPRDERRGWDDGRSRGGLLFAAGAADAFGMVPLNGDLMAGARLQVAMSLPSDGVHWLSSAVLGLTGGVDTGSSRGVDAQLYRGGLVLAIGAPWSRDVLGLGIEGGLLGGRYYDSNTTSAHEPHGESMSARPYGLGRLTVQVPVKGDVRPFLAAEVGISERPDGLASALAGLTGGLVWNAW